MTKKLLLFSLTVLFAFTVANAQCACSSCGCTDAKECTQKKTETYEEKMLRRAKFWGWKAPEPVKKSSYELRMEEYEKEVQRRQFAQEQQKAAVTLETQVADAIAALTARDKAQHDHQVKEGNIKNILDAIAKASSKPGALVNDGDVCYLIDKVTEKYGKSTLDTKSMQVVTAALDNCGGDQRPVRCRYANKVMKEMRTGTAKKYTN